MKNNKIYIIVLLSGLLYSVNSIAETRSVDVYHGGAVHSEQVDRNYHVNGANDERINTSRQVDSEHFNNDTVNINREVYSPQNAPYRGWNQGPVGMGNGWDNGWNHGYANGGWGTGLVEGLIGGIAATSLFNYFFNHNSTPSVAYVNGGSSGDGSYNTSTDSPPTEDVTNNTTTNNTVINDDGSNVGYWLLGLGLFALGAIGAVYFLRRPRNSNLTRDSYGSNYADEQSRSYSSKPRSRSHYADEDDEYAQLDNQDRRSRVPNSLRNSRIQRRRD